MSSRTALFLGRTKGQEKESIVICPPTHEGGYRTLILLFDGTGDSDDEDISNVIALKNMLHPQEDTKKQLVFYQRGIGTYSPHFPGLQIKIPLISTVSRTADSAVAWSLSYHVVEGYEWIMKNYRDGDRICMFGFSRGAYTARAVSGMIDTIGLLPMSHIDQVWPAFETFEKEDHHSSDLSHAFRKENKSRSVIIEFVGVWDTVSSVGAVYSRRLANTANNGSLKTLRHAVALDERRARFLSHMWDPPSTDPEQQPYPIVTDVDQVWFAGAHCDVGGGSVPNGTRPHLANITLRWMVRECFKTKTGIMFNRKEIDNIGISPDSLYPVVKPRPSAIEDTKDKKVSYDRIPEQPGTITRATSWVASWFVDPPPKSSPPDYSIYDNYTEEELDLADALAPIYDQLEMHPYKWGASEVMPIEAYTGPYGEKSRQFNNYSGRPIFPPMNKELTDPVAAAARHEIPIDPRWAKIRVHRTVRARMACAGDDRSPRYVPKACLNGTKTKGLDKIDPELIEWVD